MKMNLKNTMVALMMVFTTLTLSAQTFTISYTNMTTGESNEGTVNGHVSYTLEEEFDGTDTYLILTEYLNDYDARESMTSEYFVFSRTVAGDGYKVFVANDLENQLDVVVRLNEDTGVVQKLYGDGLFMVIINGDEITYAENIKGDK